MIGFDFVEAAANAKILNFSSNIAGLLAFMYFGTIHYLYGIVMGVAMVAGAYFGTRVAIKKGAAYVKNLFLFVSLWFIIKIIMAQFSKMNVSFDSGSEFMCRTIICMNKI